MAIAVVQEVHAFGTAVASITTGAITTTTGSLLISNISSLNGTGSPATSDSKTNTWADSIGVITNTGVAIYSRQQYVANATGGSGHTFTNTAGAAGYPMICVIEVSGYASSALDKTASKATDVTGTSHTTGNTATTSQAAELLVALGTGGNTYTESFTGQVGWTTQVNQTNVAASTAGGIVETKIVSAAAAYSYTFTSSGNIFSNQFISTWKEATAGAVEIKTFDGIAQSAIKTYDGIATASVKTVNGVSNV